MKCNLSIVEARRIGENFQAVVQCKMCLDIFFLRMIASIYSMPAHVIAIFQHLKKVKKKASDTVYGVATGGQAFLRAPKLVILLFASSSVCGRTELQRNLILEELSKQKIFDVKFWSPRTRTSRLLDIPYRVSV